MADSSTTGNTQGQTDATYDLDKLDPSQLPEEMKPYYNSMLSDYRKKTEAIAQQAKDAEELRQQAAQYQQTIQQYEQYYQQLVPQIQQLQQQASQSQQSAATSDAEYGGEYMSAEEEALKRFEQRLAAQDAVNQQLAQQNQQLAQQMQQYVQQFSSVMGLQDQVQSLRSQYPDFDPARVFETAKKLNTPDLEAAYKVAEFDTILEQHAEKVSQQRLEEAKKIWEQEQQNKAIAPGSPGGALPITPQRTLLEASETMNPAGRSAWNRARMQVQEKLQAGDFS